jgi:hypothetical protein
MILDFRMASDDISQIISIDRGHLDHWKDADIEVPVTSSTAPIWVWR